MHCARRISPDRFLSFWVKVYATLNPEGSRETAAAPDDALRAIGVSRPDGFVIDRLSGDHPKRGGPGPSTQLGERLGEHHSAQSSRLRFDKERDHGVAEVAPTMARRLVVLAWTTVRSCRRDLDLAVNTLDSRIRIRGNQPRSAAEAGGLRLLRTRLECWAVYSHMERAKQVHVTRAIEL